MEYEPFPDMTIKKKQLAGCFDAAKLTFPSYSTSGLLVKTET